RAIRIPGATSPSPLQRLACPPVSAIRDGAGRSDFQPAHAAARRRDVDDHRWRDQRLPLVFPFGHRLRPRPFCQGSGDLGRLDADGSELDIWHIDAPPSGRRLMTVRPKFGSPGPNPGVAARRFVSVVWSVLIILAATVAAAAELGTPAHQDAS